MATKTARRPGKTPEQRKAEREQLLGAIGDKVEALANTDEWIAYLDFTTKFRRYSFNNILLILAQKPYATRVAGYRTWLALGRQVTKGQRSIKILGYSPKTITETDADTGEESTRTVARFPVLSVFDVAQTEGDDLPDSGLVVPTGEDAAGVWDRTVAWLASIGWTVAVEEIPGSMRGFTDPEPRRVVVEETLEPAGRASTLLHEAAHVVLHSAMEDGEYQQHQGLCETEAESVAYVLSHLVGQPTDAKSIPYITKWAKADRDLIEGTAANVLRGVNEIAAGIGLDAEHEDEDDEVA